MMAALSALASAAPAWSQRPIVVVGNVLCNPKGDALQERGVVWGAVTLSRIQQEPLAMNSNGAFKVTTDHAGAEQLARSPTLLIVIGRPGSDFGAYVKPSASGLRRYHGDTAYQIPAIHSNRTCEELEEPIAEKLNERIASQAIRSTSRQGPLARAAGLVVAASAGLGTRWSAPSAPADTVRVLPLQDVLGRPPIELNSRSMAQWSLTPGFRYTGNREIVDAVFQNPSTIEQFYPGYVTVLTDVNGFGRTSVSVPLDEYRIVVAAGLESYGQEQAHTVVIPGQALRSTSSSNVYTGVGSVTIHLNAFVAVSAGIRAAARTGDVGDTIAVPIVFHFNRPQSGSPFLIALRNAKVVPDADIGVTVYPADFMTIGATITNVANHQSAEIGRSRLAGAGVKLSLGRVDVGTEVSTSGIGPAFAAIGADVLLLRALSVNAGFQSRGSAASAGITLGDFGAAVVGGRGSPASVLLAVRTRL